MLHQVNELAGSRNNNQISVLGVEGEGQGPVREVSRDEIGRPYWPLMGVELMCTTKSLGVLNRGAVIW